MLSTEFNSLEQANKNLQLFRDRLYEIYVRELQLIDYYELAEKFQEGESNPKP